MRALILFALMLPTPAWAACTCQCVDGKAQNVCSRQADFPVVCLRLCIVPVQPAGRLYSSAPVTVTGTGPGSETITLPVAAGTR